MKRAVKQADGPGVERGRIPFKPANLVNTVLHTGVGYHFPSRLEIILQPFRSVCQQTQTGAGGLKHSLGRSLSSGYIRVHVNPEKRRTVQERYSSLPH